MDSMQQRPDISIIVVSYNTREMTVEALESVYKSEGDVAFEVIVVDNASTDGSADAIAERLPQVRLIRSEENLGFGRANNIAAEAAQGRYILLLNPDTLVFPTSLQSLMDFAKDQPQARIWGGRTVFADGSLNPTSVWRGLSLWSLTCAAFLLTGLFKNSSLFNPEAYGGWRRDEVREVDIVTGCYLLIETGLWRELKGFDPEFFMYAEEADLCYRGRQLGARPMFTPNSTIVHYGGASETARGPKLVRLYAGKVTFMRKHWSPLRYRLGVGIYLFHVLIHWIAYGAIRLATRSTRARGAFEAWRHVWRNRPAWVHGY